MGGGRGTSFWQLASGNSSWRRKPANVDSPRTGTRSCASTLSWTRPSLKMKQSLLRWTTAAPSCSSAIPAAETRRSSPFRASSSDVASDGWSNNALASHQIAQMSRRGCQRSGVLSFICCAVLNRALARPAGPGPTSPSRRGTRRSTDEGSRSRETREAPRRWLHPYRAFRSSGPPSTGSLLSRARSPARSCSRHCISPHAAAYRASISTAHLSLSNHTAGEGPRGPGQVPPGCRGRGGPAAARSGGGRARADAARGVPVQAQGAARGGGARAAAGVLLCGCRGGWGRRGPRGVPVARTRLQPRVDPPRTASDGRCCAADGVVALSPALERRSFLPFILCATCCSLHPPLHPG